MHLVVLAFRIGQSAHRLDVLPLPRIERVFGVSDG